MRSTSIPTASNDSEVESYETYKDRKVARWEERMKEIRIEVKDSSLTAKDKEVVLFDLLKKLIHNEI